MSLPKKYSLVILFFLPLILLGSLLGFGVGTTTFLYVWTEPKFCTTCHVHDYANTTWSKSPHGAVTHCMDCHQQPLSRYFAQLGVFFTRFPKFPKDMRSLPHVPIQACTQCHDMNKSYLHTLHLKRETTVMLPRDLPMQDQASQFGILGKDAPQLKKARPVECVDCHGTPANRVHVLTVADRTCIQCHAKAHTTQLVQTYGCRTCHAQDFLTPSETPERNRIKSDPVELPTE